MHKGSTLQTQSEKDRWQIADFHLVYSTGAASPRDVANNVIAASRTMRKQKPANCLLVSSSEQDILLQAAASHERWSHTAGVASSQIITASSCGSHVC